MDYKDILGYSEKKPKKKFIKEYKSSVTDLLKEEFGDIDMGKVYTAKDKPPFKTSQQLKEGPAADYEPYIHAIDQNYKKYWDSVKIFQKHLDKKGLKGASKGIGNAYKNLVLKFHKLFAKVVRKLM